jgi:hypothetical protein
MADPVPVDIFVGMLLLCDAMQLTVFLAQIHVNGPMSHML